MDFGAIVDLISSVGFPIALVIVLGFFIYKIYTDQQATNKENMEQVQSRCKEREEKLYTEIKANREVNAQAVATIALYADKLESIQHDVADIKTSLAVLSSNTGS